MSALKGSALRSLDWRRPKGLSLPRVFETAISRLTEAAERLSTPIAAYLAKEAPRGPDASPRTRKMRSDGHRNLLAMLTSCIAVADARHGFLGIPGAEGGWQRRDVQDLDFFAYGRLVPGERSLRRSERHLRELASMGLIRTRQIRRQVNGGWESVTAVRHVTQKAWQLLGVWNAIRQLQKQRDQEKNAAKTRELGRLAVDRGIKVFAGKPEAQSPAPGATSPPETPPIGPPRSPPSGPTPEGLEKMRETAQLLGIKKTR